MNKIKNKIQVLDKQDEDSILRLVKKQDKGRRLLLQQQQQQKKRNVIAESWHTYTT